MGVLQIITYPDEILKKSCKKVEVFDDNLKKLVDDMITTMYAAPGVGLAANQVGIDLRVFVIDVSEPEEPNGATVFINPEIIEKSGEIEWEEGCLSFPGVLVDVQRNAKVKVKAQDLNENYFELEASDLFAVAIQHELDHLNGVSLINKVSFLRKRLITKELLRYKKENK